MGRRSPFKIEVDKSTQVIKLDVPPDRSLPGGEATFQARPPLGARQMMPASLIAHKAKMFDDGLMAADDLGLDIQVGPTETALDWLKHWQSDPDLGEDIRCMLPLYYDPVMARFKVLAVVGYTSRPLEISFASPPAVVVRDSLDRVVDADLEFDSQRENLIYPVAIQFYTSQLLSRDQFRTLCNTHSCLSSLREALPIG